MHNKEGTKLHVLYEHWDRLFSPVACGVMITTVVSEGRINAGSFATAIPLAPEVLKRG
jgi:hypothetical protein